MGAPAELRAWPRPNERDGGTVGLYRLLKKNKDSIYIYVAVARNLHGKTLAGLFMSQVKPRGSDRVGSSQGDLARPVIF